MFPWPDNLMQSVPEKALTPFFGPPATKYNKPVLAGTLQRAMRPFFGAPIAPVEFNQAAFPYERFGGNGKKDMARDMMYRASDSTGRSFFARANRRSWLPWAGR